MSYRTSSRRWGPPACLLILTAFLTPPATAQDTTLRDERGFHRVLYCWTHWWEIHREDYLYSAQPRQRRLDRDPAAPHRERAVEALLVATEAADESLRAAAALSLGRIGDPRALPALQRLAEERVEEDVRRSAWVAMGLLDTEASRDALPDPAPLSGQDADAWLTAVALLDDAEDLLPDVKDMLANDPMARTRRRAAHVLRIHSPPDLREIAHEVLRASTDPAVVDEAILALGEVADEADLDLLLDLLSGRGQARELPVHRARRNRRATGPAQPQLPGGLPAGPRAERSTPRFRPGPDQPDEGWASAAIALQHFTDLGARDRERVRHALRDDFGSAFTALMLGLERRIEQPTHGASILTLERVGSRREIAALQRALRGENILGRVPVVRGGPDGADRRLRQRRPDPRATRTLPTRSFAAIALGLHMRALGPEGRPVEDVPDRERSHRIRDIGLALGPFLRNSSESNHFRAASALALGLGGDTAHIPRLMDAAERMEAGDELVLGYTLLALGLLGEPATIGAAERFIGPPIEADQLERMLGQRPDYRDWFADYRDHRGRAAAAGRGDRLAGLPAHRMPPLTTEQLERRLAARAIVHGLAALGDDRAAPALIGEWGKDYFVSLEIARALARCEHYDIADPLITFMREERFERFARLAALSLGELFDREDPPRLNRLLRGNNYQAAVRSALPRSENLAPAPEAVQGAGDGARAARPWRPDTRGFANEFLYHYLYTQRPPGGFLYTR